MCWKRIVAAAVVVLASISVASATSWSLSTNISAVYDSSFNVLQGGAGPYPANHPPQSSEFVNPVAGGSIYQVDFYLSISNLNAGSRGFANMDFSIALTGGISNTTTPGWHADGSTVDINGAAAGGGTPLWYYNGDAGVSNSDLQFILVGNIPIAPGFNSADMRPLIGQVSGPKPYTNALSPTPVNVTGWATGTDSLQNKTYLGTLYVDWNTLLPGVLTASFIQASNADLITGNGSVDPTPVFTPAVVSFVPEPGSVVLMGLGGAGFIAVARRHRRTKP